MALELVKSEPDSDIKNICFDEVQERKITLSRKFIAFLICIITGLISYLVYVSKHNEINSLGKFLDFIVWIFIAYIGGNSAELLTEKLGTKWEK